MPAEQLKRYLDHKAVKYLVLRHSPAYTAQEIAANAHVSGKTMVKTVIVKVNGELAMAVLPASEMVDIEMLTEALGATRVQLAEESEFAGRFNGCELGAIPPFGNLFDMQVYVSPIVAENHDIIFSAGTHSELIDLAYEDFERLVQPAVLPFAIPCRTYLQEQDRSYGLDGAVV